MLSEDAANGCLVSRFMASDDVNVDMVEAKTVTRLIVEDKLTRHLTSTDKVSETASHCNSKAGKTGSVSRTMTEILALLFNEKYSDGNETTS